MTIVIITKALYHNYTVALMKSSTNYIQKEKRMETWISLKDMSHGSVLEVV